MKLLHILKSEPDGTTKALINILSEGADASQFPLYEPSADYEKLLDSIFENDKVISWW